MDKKLLRENMETAAEEVVNLKVAVAIKLRLLTIIFNYEELFNENERLKKENENLKSENAKKFWPGPIGPPYPWPILPTTPVAPVTSCSVCGLDFKGIMGYCCSRADCPSGVTCLESWGKIKLTGVESFTANIPYVPFVAAGSKYTYNDANTQFNYTI